MVGQTGTRDSPVDGVPDGPPRGVQSARSSPRNADSASSSEPSRGSSVTTSSASTTVSPVGWRSSPFRSIETRTVSSGRRLRSFAAAIDSPAIGASGPTGTSTTSVPSGSVTRSVGFE